ncbi:MAG TPA: hypothetical protein PLO78_05315 [Candidatus Omnitrophota bacterium]|nr:hypothetical protein [Candidatus Omnitrophota bacterium]
METQKEISKNENKIIADVPRNGNDIYRVSAWTGKEGKHFLDLRVYYTKDGKLRKTREGVNVLARLRREIAAALLAAKNAAEIPEPSEGKNCETAFVSAVAVSETEQYQISKVRGPKNRIVRISYAFKGGEGSFIPSSRKALSILESSVEGVAAALQSPEAEPMPVETSVQPA